MNIKVNDIIQTVEENTSLNDLLHSLRMDSEAIVTVLNDAVIPIEKRFETVLCEGDCLDLVSLVGGG